MPLTGGVERRPVQADRCGCGPLIITCLSLLLANLFCSMHTRMNINAMEGDSPACCMNTHANADRLQKLEWHIHTRTMLLCAPPSETRERLPTSAEAGRFLT